MSKVKCMLLVTLVLGAVTLAQGIEVLSVTGIEVLSTGEAIVLTRVTQAPVGATLQSVMAVGGIEVLAEQLPVPPGGGMFPVHFPLHQIGNHVRLVGPAGEVITYIDCYELD